MSILGDDDPKFDQKRYMKFHWNDASAVPPVGQRDFVPKGGAMRLFEEGVFRGSHLLAFPPKKGRLRLQSLGRCAFCERTHDSQGNQLPLTSEHIIPEALGAGIELPDGTCPDCQKVTAEFESSVITEMFDSVRRSLSLDGKSGVLMKQNFPVDVAQTTTELAFLNERDHPTILTIPQLFPAALYSRRSLEQNGFFNLIVYNINCRKEALDKYGILGFSPVLIDTARFCQVVAKIAHTACAHFNRKQSFKPLVADLIRTSLPPKTPSKSHYNCVGRLWQDRDNVTENLHEVEVGEIDWNGKQLIAARVRLFACLGIPSFHVAVGEAPTQLENNAEPLPLGTVMTKTWDEGFGPEDPVTEDSVARAFAERQAGWLCYCAERRAWYVFDGAVWRRDRTGIALQRAREVAREIGAPLREGSLSEREAVGRPVTQEVLNQSPWRFVAGVERFARADPMAPFSIPSW